MVWNATLPQVTNPIVQGPARFQTNQAALETALSNGTLIASLPYIPPTAPVYFWTDTIPAGWSGAALTGDCLLAIQDTVSGVNHPYFGAGGTVTGVWSTGGHSLIPSELPLPPAGASQPGILATVNLNLQAALPHTHDWTTTRPTAAVGIMCTKNP